MILEFIKRFFVRKEEIAAIEMAKKKKLEKIINEDFSLAIDTTQLIYNLSEFRKRQDLADYNSTDILDVFNRLIKKANVVYSAYGKGKFRFVANELVQSAIDVLNNYNSQKIRRYNSGNIGSGRDIIKASIRYSRAA